MKTFAFIIFIFSSLLSAQDFPYRSSVAGYKTTHEYVVKGMSPIKAQDGIGLCYGFSATSLLEHYRCKELKLDCSDPKNMLSSLDVTSYYTRERLIQGGDTFKILSNIESTPRNLASEECAKFSALVNAGLVTNYKTKQQEKVVDEQQGWKFLITKWNEYRGLNGATRNDCVSCLADSIKNTLVNIQTPADQIKNAFLASSTLEDFLYKTLLPVQCLSPAKALNIPAYRTGTYPGYKEPFSAEGMKKKIELLLMNDMPLEMGICTINMSPCPEKSPAHSIALMGIKEVCSGGNCKKMVLVKNSYGMGWQKQNNDGWVDLNNLVEASMNMGSTHNLSWVEKPGMKLEEKYLNGKTSIAPTVYKPAGASTNSVPVEYQNYKGMWRCPGNSFTQNYEPGCRPMNQ